MMGNFNVTSTTKSSLIVDFLVVAVSFIHIRLSCCQVGSYKTQAAIVENHVYGNATFVSCHSSKPNLQPSSV